MVGAFLRRRDRTVRSLRVEHYSSAVNKRLTAPVQVPEDPALRRDLAAAVARIERTLRVLYEVEKQRVEDSAGAETWQALVRRAGARIDAEDALG